MRIILLAASMALCSCRVPSPQTSGGESLQQSILEAIVESIEGKCSSGITGIHFTQEQRNQIKSYKFYDPLILANPRYFDIIKSVKDRQMQRHYLGYSGNVVRIETVTLSAADFWEPLNLLSKYYSKYDFFPIGTDLSIPLLKGLVAH